MFRQSRHRSAVWALMLSCALLPTSAHAQPDSPRLMLNTGGPVGGLRAVAFSADGTQLYAAGAGKTVSVWNLIRQPQGVQAVPADPLRWEIARGMRGRIYTLDVAGTEGPLAIGGYSARGANGDLVLFDPRQRQIDDLLPVRRPDVPGPGPSPGHVQTVGSVDFSPDGRQLVSVSIDGEVRLWTLGDNPVSAILQQASGVEDGLIRAAAFVGGRRLIVPLRDPQDPTAWRLRFIDPINPNRPATVLSQPVFSYGVADIALTTDGAEFAASDLIGQVTLFSNGTRLVPRPLNRPRHAADGRAVRTVASLGYNPQRLLAISTTADANGVCWLELWDTAANPPRLVLEREAGRGQAAASVRFSPDGSLLALTRADRSAVELIPVRGGAAPLDVDRVLELTGRGREPGRVQFVGNAGYRIAVDSPADEERLLFDLQTLEVLEPGDEPIPPESRPVDASGWRVVPQPAVGGVQQLQVFAPQGTMPRCSIQLQTVHQGTYRLHTWLTDSQGQVYGVAVATDRQDGVFLYDLPAAGQCRLMRYLRDHADTIRSLSVSADGRFLVSSSADQTVKIWSLAALQNVNATFPREDAWGASFAIENGRVVVQSAIGSGIAVHRDLLTGDVITQAEYAGTNGNVPATDAPAILQLLAERPLWEQLTLTTLRDGQQREAIQIVPAWEPLATLFVDRSREWALWTPQGVYDASASGDELFGWHINIARDQDPQYFRAEQFRRELEKPDVMRQLLISGSLQDALIALAAAPPRTIGDVAGDIPRVRLINPRAGDAVGAGGTIAVEAAVRYPDSPELNADDYRVRLWINQRDGGEPQNVRELDGETIYSWDIPPDAEQNRVLVLVEEASGDVDSLFEDAWVQVAADVPPPDISVHVFALAAQNYAGDMWLNYCNDDARGVAELLQKHDGKRYKPGQVRILTDDEEDRPLERARVLEEIAQFQKQLEGVPPDDILVVFVCGHGVAYGKDYFFLPPHPDLTHNSPEAFVRRIGIAWEDLRLLADVNCRKLFLLDTCFSGNVTLAEKAALRPLKKSQALVVAAVAPGEKAMATGPGVEHTLFTGYLLKGCNGEADGVDAYAPMHPRYVPLRDGMINLKEIVSYVSYNSRRYFQSPKCVPADLFNFVDLSLFRVTNAAGPLPQAPAR
jgi:WD40 repeat protein